MALITPKFKGVMASPMYKMRQPQKKITKPTSDLTISELVGGLKTAQFWTVLVALVALFCGAFALGQKLHGMQWLLAVRFSGCEWTKSAKNSEGK